MVSQFVSTHAVNLLGDLDFDFPEGIHAVGGLDNLSKRYYFFLRTPL
jgi:23S rRNA pseudouridine2457 synthase